MPTSKRYFPDVNVLLALVFERHEHHARVLRWFDGVPDASVTICRVTQMGMLRLLSNRAVMGEDCLTSSDAWNVYDRLRDDPRVLFAMEPAQVETRWRQHVKSGGVRAGAAWTDGYLGAFARTLEIEGVTLDSGLAKLGIGFLLCESG